MGSIWKNIREEGSCVHFRAGLVGEVGPAGTRREDQWGGPQTGAATFHERTQLVFGGQEGREERTTEPPDPTRTQGRAREHRAAPWSTEPVKAVGEEPTGASRRYKGEGHTHARMQNRRCTRDDNVNIHLGEKIDEKPTQKVIIIVRRCWGMGWGFW